MRINSLSQPLSAEFRKVESARKNEKTSATQKISGDRSELSAKGQRLNETKAQIESINTSLAAIPEIREDKVEEVREKIESGYYNSKEFIDKLADKMLNDLGMTNTDT